MTVGNRDAKDALRLGEATCESVSKGLSAFLERFAGKKGEGPARREKDSSFLSSKKSNAARGSGKGFCTPPGPRSVRGSA